MTIRKVKITDSRGLEWEVTVSGPYRSGALPEGGSLDELPEKWRATYEPASANGEISLEVPGPDTSPEDLRSELERDARWEQKEWERP